MQAQVKDEVQEAQPLDGTSQKSVTDWLMHVISGKQPSTEERMRAATQEAAQSASIFNLEPPVAPKETNGHATLPEAWTGAFTAEDLCGAPAIPMPVAAKAVPAEDEITANDVCWVPEELRLKPQPMLVEAPKPEPMAPVMDIMRDVAPQFVSAAPVLEEQEITAADISRQWVIDEMEQAAAVAAPEPEMVPVPQPEPDYAAQMVSAPVQQEIAAPEPVAVVVAAPEIVPDPVAAHAETARPEPEIVTDPFAAYMEAETKPEPEVISDPFAAHAEAVTHPEPELTPVSRSTVLHVWAEPDTKGADFEVAQAEPLAQAEPEIVVAQAEILPAQAVEAPEIADASAVQAEADEHSGVAEPDKYAGVKVWAKGGYWDGAHPAADGTEGPILDGSAGSGRVDAGPIAEGQIEKGPAAAHPSGARGYFGSYLGPEDLEELEKAKPEGWSQSWRTLIRLGAALPWLSRALPALESGMGNQPGASGPGMGQGLGQQMGSGAAQGAQQGAASPEMQQDVAGMRLVQYEIRTTVQDHSAHLKRMEDQLTRVRESVESKSADRALAENVQSAMKLLKMVGIGLGGLLVVLIVLSLIMVMKH